MTTKLALKVFLLTILVAGCTKDPLNGEAEKSIQHADSSVLAAAVSADGTYSIVSAEGHFEVYGDRTDYEVVRDDVEGVKVWNNETDSLVHNFFHGEAPNQVKAIAISADNNFFATAEEGTVKLWDMETLENLEYWKFESNVRHLSLSRTGRYLAIATQTGQIAHVDTVSGRQLVYLGHGNDQNNGQINSMDLTLSGRFVLSGGIDKTTKLWDGESGQTMRTFEHPTRVSTVAMDSQAKYAFTSDVIKAHRIWDLRTGKLHRKLEIVERFSWFSAATFNPDGSLLATGSPNQEIILWHVDSGKQLARWKTTPFSSILDIKFVDDFILTENSKGLAEWRRLPERLTPLE